jgi:OOP family OmpA-OmpF porin
MKKKCIRALLGLAMATLACAASAQDANIYLGANYGKSHFTNGCSLGPAPCDKDRDTGGGFFGGLQFNRFLGVEAGWHSPGTLRVGGVDIKTSVVDLVGVLTVPVQGRFAAYVKGGAYHGDMKSDFGDVRKDGGTFGWGLQYNAGASGAVRAEYQRFANMGGKDLPETTHVDMFTIGILFRIR